MTLVESLKRFCIVQKPKIPTNWAAIPTISKYVRVSVLYETTVFWRVEITVTVVLRESPSKLWQSIYDLLPFCATTYKYPIRYSSIASIPRSAQWLSTRSTVGL